MRETCTPETKYFTGKRGNQAFIVAHIDPSWLLLVKEYCRSCPFNSFLRIISKRTTQLYIFFNLCSRQGRKTRCSYKHPWLISLKDAFLKIKINKNVILNRYAVKTDPHGRHARKHLITKTQKHITSFPPHLWRTSISRQTTISQPRSSAHVGYPGQCKRYK